MTHLIYIRMSSLSVLNNIDLINKQIEQLKQELLRLEGSKRVFEQFKSVGIETINSPQDIIENDEVIDTVVQSDRTTEGPDDD